ncbi:MAG TPA: hypothetical protein VHR97_11170 [Candidatus Baltobacteraceae bacterium]|jgi:hypothetical protein|nr:hypothetical protein [Candidatus Baltobacteraceae bacterium]
MTESALAERGKEKISAAAAIELVKKFAKDRYKEDKANSDRALAHAREMAGGQIERIDKDVIEQGRAWATRLALISRTTGNGSGPSYYQASRPNAAVVPIVKKLFGIIGELEAIVATDTEISLFQKPDENDYFGFGEGLKKLTVASLTEDADPGDTIKAEDIVEGLVEELGDPVREGVVELLKQYEIEPIVVPEDQKPAKNGRRRRS